MIEGFSKRNRKITIIIILIILFGITAFFLVGINRDKHSNITLSQVEAKSDVILLGVLTHRKDEVDKIAEDGSSLLSYTGEFKIRKVFVNNMDQTINKNDSISVKETERLLPIPEQERAYYIYGYMKMKESQEYLLFLEYSNEEKLYSPVESGKVPVNTAEIINSLEAEEGLSKADLETVSIQLQIADDARRKYL
jgi:hypothetical protein